MNWAGLPRARSGELLKSGHGASVSKQLTKLFNALKTDLALQEIQTEIKTALKTEERA